MNYLLAFLFTQGPVVTDNDIFILDWNFEDAKDWKHVENSLNM